MRIKTSLLLATALATTSGLAACGEDPDVSTSAEDIIGGVPARSATLNAVGALGFKQFGATNFSPVCSATLIAPTVVLTAEHCVDFVSDPQNQLQFLIGFDAFHPIRAVPVRGVTMEQSFTGGLVGLGIDMAIVHLAEPVTNVQPFPIAAPTAAQLDLRFAGIGYGIQNMNGAYGTRMTGSMTFQQSGGRMWEAIYGTFEAFVADAGRFGLSPNNPDDVAILQQAWDQELLQDNGIEGWFGHGFGDAQTCFGDSGGPITKAVNGKPTVYGVASFVAFANPERTFCDLGAAYATFNPTALDFVAYEKACPMIPRGGHCLDLDTVERCATPEEGGYRPLTTDCGELGMICGYDEAGELGCVEDPCADIAPEGQCNGTVATRCTTPEEGNPRRVVSTDCADLGGTCAVGAEGVECVGIECAHDKCAEGVPLAGACDSCVADICEVDAYCCDVGWDSICVGEVGSVCGAEQACSGAPVIAPGTRTR